MYLRKEVLRLKEIDPEIKRPIPASSLRRRQRMSQIPSTLDTRRPSRSPEQTQQFHSSRYRRTSSKLSPTKGKLSAPGIGYYMIIKVICVHIVVKTSVAVPFLYTFNISEREKKNGLTLDITTRSRINKTYLMLNL